MRSLSFFFITLLGMAIPAFSNETALCAIQVLRETNRPELLSGLAEIKGEQGSPQPEEWLLLCNDPNAQGGIRELVVKEHHIVSERTPLHSFEGEGDLAQLNTARVTMDSNALFLAANQEAIAHHIGFDSLNYTLRIDAVTGNPLWVVQLYKIGKETPSLVGSLQFSAETATLMKGL